ncbi:shikimate dehydrogenase [Eupransor demetentiae]|uniref:Shikimate dehydrogenase (NADP(+)) n=1 Tax=Eupransor demetentiae TaxID=3109584 RepID=A0ABP0EQ53_9LACO|nr:Shikimate 5-dehydrogenase (AroE) [Lactobacillaceae bacterium LMG 33000]
MQESQNQIKKYGLLAHPAGHSLSPRMQNAMMKAAGIAARYQAYDLNPEHFVEEIENLKAGGLVGFNVSTPFKKRVMAELDDLSPLSQKLQAVNTVAYRNGRWQGTSTDGDGFWQSLPQSSYKKVVLLGTGGAARAVIASAPEYGVSDLTVFNRKGKTWQDKVEMIGLLNSQADLEDLANTSGLKNRLAEADLVVNATSVGMDNEGSLLDEAMLATLPKEAFVVDMIYRQAQTPLLKLATEAGLSTQNGLPMLVAQGALSFEYWFGQKADRELMQKAIEVKR